MSDLFSHAPQSGSPLPARLRPHDWEGFVGQQALRAKLQGRALHSMILYGPPGCGKTTLAGLLAEHAGLPFTVLSAVSAGVKEVRAVIEAGQQRFRNQGRGVVLFLDEIHRFTKTQQDAMLEAVEAGWITLIGATTENPSFEVVGPLLSRCQVYRLLPLSEEDLGRLLDRALAEDPVLVGYELAPDARALLLEAAGGDARRLLAGLELAALGADSSGESRRSSDTTAPTDAADSRHSSDAGKRPQITRANALAALEGRVRNYDRAGENHYDFISAFIKSLRGSDPDAALLYLACMIEGGEDPLFIARRMVIFAAEDIGNASHQALELATAAFAALERIGMPEGRIVLGQCATFLAACPKSNAAYAAIDAALAAVRNRVVRVPNHLRNAPTRTHKNEGAAQGYRYPHDFPGHFVKERYLPEGFEDTQFYFPNAQGQEERLKERLRLLWPERKYES